MFDGQALWLAALQSPGNPVVESGAAQQVFDQFGYQEGNQPANGPLKRGFSYAEGGKTLFGAEDWKLPLRVGARWR